MENVFFFQTLRGHSICCRTLVAGLQAGVFLNLCWPIFVLPLHFNDHRGMELPMIKTPKRAVFKRPHAFDPALHTTLIVPIHTYASNNNCYKHIVDIHTRTKKDRTMTVQEIPNDSASGSQLQTRCHNIKFWPFHTFSIPSSSGSKACHFFSVLKTIRANCHRPTGGISSQL